MLLDQLQGFSSSWVSKSDGIVMCFHNGSTDKIISRDADIAIASSDSIYMCLFPQGSSHGLRALLKQLVKGNVD